MLTPRSFVLALCFSPVALAQPTQWSGNGHWYQVIPVPTGISWEAANVAATGMGGHLATLTGAEETLFAYTLAYADPTVWFLDGAGNGQGPWLGGFQLSGSAEPGGGWTWVTGEPWSFAAWAPGEPNNYGGNESRLQFFGYHQLRGSNWNDVSQAPYADVRGYIVEWETNPCPADFNGDGFLDIYDFVDFVTCFEGNACPPGTSADFNNDGFADIFDFNDFVDAFEVGC